MTPPRDGPGRASAGGRFVAELGGTGNVRAIVDALEAELADPGCDGGHPWYFASIGEYAPRLEGRRPPTASLRRGCGRSRRRALERLR